MARWLYRLFWPLLLLASLALRVVAPNGSSGGVPWHVWAHEIVLGVVVYVVGLFAIAAPFVAFSVAREAYRAHRAAPLPRVLVRYHVGVCVACLALTTAYFGLMVRYGSSPRPTVRYRMEHGTEPRRSP